MSDDDGETFESLVSNKAKARKIGTSEAGSVKSRQTVASAR